MIVTLHNAPGYGDNPVAHDTRTATFLPSLTVEFFSVEAADNRADSAGTPPARHTFVFQFIFQDSSGVYHYLYSNEESTHD